MGWFAAAHRKLQEYFLTAIFNSHAFLLEMVE